MILRTVHLDAGLSVIDHLCERMVARAYSVPCIMSFRRSGCVMLHHSLSTSPLAASQCLSAGVARLHNIRFGRKTLYGGAKWRTGRPGIASTSTFFISYGILAVLRLLGCIFYSSHSLSVAGLIRTALVPDGPDLVSKAPGNELLAIVKKASRLGLASVCECLRSLVDGRWSMDVGRWLKWDITRGKYGVKGP